MSGTESYSSEVRDFDYTDIFPQCNEEYNDAKRRYDNFYTSRLGHGCRGFCVQVAGSKPWTSLNADCLELGKYLYHINYNSSIEKKRSCKYLFYKLLLEKNYKKLNCESVSLCFNNMKTHLEKELYLKSKSYNCSNHFNNLDVKAYGVFDILDHLYNYIYKIKNSGRICHNSERVSCDGYINTLKSCEYKDGENFKKLLKIIEAEYEKLCPKTVVPIDVKHDTLHHNSMTETDAETELKITEFGSSSKALKPEVRPFIGIIKLPEASQHKLKSEDISTGSVNGISTSTIVLMPYTTYCVLLQKSVKKSKRLLNKDNKEYINLKNSYEKSYKNITDYNYQFMYSSVDS
ncbi:variable surface protein [Plasmodium gonderi]|uniref:Variable surface protein n=1 Tax=Plasmodium gonderi TaxID=77519 RepID=A0A1Y1JQI1_PLAGO|nr:variable surface protein [Plasmodium gonderi]GAW84460.1 variable surface protein [Plasmodium gonderi]